MINSLTVNYFIFGIRDPKLINTVKWMDSDRPPTLPKNKFGILRRKETQVSTNSTSQSG